MDRKRYLPSSSNEDKKLIRLFSDTMQEIRALYFQAVESNDQTKARRLLKQLGQISKSLESEYGNRADYSLTKEYVKGAYYINDVVKG